MIKVTITAAGQPPFLLAQSGLGRIIAGASANSWNNGAGGPVEEGFLPRLRYNAQPVKAIRAANERNLPRFNLAREGRFTVSREFHTTGACILFLATHLELIPVSGVLALTYSGTDGTAGTLYLPATMKSADTIEHIGRFCKISYAYVSNGGGWSTVNPT